MSRGAYHNRIKLENECVVIMRTIQSCAIVNITMNINRSVLHTTTVDNHDIDQGIPFEVSHGIAHGTMAYPME